jgi:hypothetical protein
MKAYVIITVIFLSLLAAVGWQRERIRVISGERDAYRQNTYSLLETVESYKTKDLLNVASISEMELKISELQKYRQKDMELLETLNVDRKRLQQIITSQIQTLYRFSGTVRDSIVHIDHYPRDTLPCIDITDTWFDLHGCIDGNAKFSGTFESRDSLMYVEHIVPHRFLFIKWGCRQRRQEIVSRNPNTRILGAEFIRIRK